MQLTTSPVLLRATLELQDYNSQTSQTKDDFITKLKKNTNKYLVTLKNKLF